MNLESIASSAYAEALLKSLALDGLGIGTNDYATYSSSVAHSSSSHASAAIPPDVQVLAAEHDDILNRAFDESTLLTEVEALRRLHEMSEQTLLKHPQQPAPKKQGLAAGVAGATTATAAITTQTDGPTNNTSNNNNNNNNNHEWEEEKARRFKLLKEHLDVHCEQIPDLAQLTLLENEKLAKLFLQWEERQLYLKRHGVPGSAASANLHEDSQHLDSLLQFITNNFHRGIAEIEKLIGKWVGGGASSPALWS